MEEKLTVPIEISNRHVHLSPEIVQKLFGEAGITKKNDLGGGQYACNETVVLKGPKGEIAKVRVLGPARNYNQAELLTADQFKLGVKAPERMSGNLEGAAELTIIGPAGEVVLPCGIIAHRHIHVGTEYLKKYGLDPKKEVTVRVEGERGGTLEHVLFKCSPDDEPPTMHIDQEEGNAFGIKVHGIGLVTQE